MVPFTNSVPMIYCVMSVLAIGSGVNTPCNQSMLSKLAPKESIGGVLGVGQSLATLGRIVGPALGGLFFGKLGAQVPYMVAAAFMTVAFSLSLLLPKLQSAAIATVPVDVTTT